MADGENGRRKAKATALWAAESVEGGDRSLKRVQERPRGCDGGDSGREAGVFMKRVCLAGLRADLDSWKIKADESWQALVQSHCLGCMIPMATAVVKRDSDGDGRGGERKTRRGGKGVVVYRNKETDAGIIVVTGGAFEWLQ